MIGSLLVPGISFPTATTAPMLTERVRLWFFVRSRQKYHKIVPAGLLISSAAPQMTCAANHNHP
ncbi:MAG: hypothetical protein ACLT4O_04820 [Clostridia bacterium]